MISIVFQWFFNGFCLFLINFHHLFIIFIHFSSAFAGAEPMEEEATGSGPPEADGYEVDQPMAARCF